MLQFLKNDEECFLWSILASLHPLQYRNNLDRDSRYQEYEHELKMAGIQYSVDIKDIGKFEHQNKISVNVYGYEDKNIFQLRIITVTTVRYHVNLSFVKKLSKVISIQYNSHNGKHCFCQYCLHGCTSEEVLKNNLGRGKLRGAQKIKL